MTLNRMIASRPVFIFTLLAIGVLLLPSVVIPWWYSLTKHMENKVELNLHVFRSAMLSEIENIAKLLHPINSSAINLARLVMSSLNGRTKPTTSDINKKVVPLLFQAISMMPFISQISFIGLEGLFFSYYHDGNHTFAMYSVLSSTNPEVRRYNWYKQIVDPNTGKPYGDAIKTSPLLVENASWIQGALGSTHGYASIGKGWNSAQDPLFLNTVSVNGHGVISLGFPVTQFINFFNGMNFNGGSSCLVTQAGDVLVRGFPNTKMVVTGNWSVSFYLMKPVGDQTSYVGNVSCMPNNGRPKGSTLNTGETKYMAYCSPLEIVGVQSVYVLAFPYDGLVHGIHRSSKNSLILLLIMVAVIMIAIFSFVFLMVKAATREMHLCASLIKQTEATQQAERKSMNKSLAFASASHDIRAALAGITGLIEISYEEVTPSSELETHLRQMEGCTKDLVGLLNSILDTSKIEAGKMQLEEEEFDLPNLLEDVVDLFHPVGMKKGVDVVLDSFDGSILKFSRVKGDRGKLKQVLSNLLSNAVKFTNEGHISVRAWAQKPSAEKKIIASNRNSSWKHFSWLMFFKNKEELKDIDAVNAVKENPNSMELVFEVDDTGKGIPKEKQQSVFENYVQVKETSLGQGGTGLGLGIVQSLVRLMGGEIGIVDKGNGERGTCFRFNIFVTTCESPSTDNTKGDIEMGGDSICDGSNKYSGLTVKTSTPSFNKCNPSTRLAILGSSPRIETSHVVLLIQNEERRRATQKFMESLGIKVSVVKQLGRLHSTLTKIRSKQNASPWSSSGISDVDVRRANSTGRSKDVPLSYMDGTDQEPPSYTSNTLRGAPIGFVLLVIDATAGPFQELYGTVAEFKGGFPSSCCKVVWLDKPTSRSIDYSSFEGDMIDPGDDILLKPFHGSRLYQAIKLLPEFGGGLTHGVSSNSKRQNRIQDRKVLEDPNSSSSSTKRSYRRTRSSKIPSSHEQPLEQVDKQAEDSSRREENKRKSLTLDPILSGSGSGSRSRNSSTERHPIKTSEIREENGNLNSEKPLDGLKFLVAEDSNVLRKLARANLLRLGATVELCENGEEALYLIRTGLHYQRRHENSSIVLPYDYILMDCEMPIMDGYEATKQIRQEEETYGVHIPIIALTAHISSDEAAKTVEAGMDLCLSKPLERERLVEAIRDFQSK